MQHKIKYTFQLSSPPLHRRHSHSIGWYRWRHCRIATWSRRLASSRWTAWLRTGWRAREEATCRWRTPEQSLSSSDRQASLRCKHVTMHDVTTRNCCVGDASSHRSVHFVSPYFFVTSATKTLQFSIAMLSESCQSWPLLISCTSWNQVKINHFRALKFD